MSTPRASIFDTEELDIAAFVPKPGPDRSAPSPADVRAVAEAANFRSREASGPAVPKRQPRRHRTGRNVQFNIKVSQEAIDQFYAIADQQGWVLGETLEYALAALETVLNKQGKVGQK